MCAEPSCLFSIPFSCYFNVCQLHVRTEMDFFHTNMVVYLSTLFTIGTGTYIVNTRKMLPVYDVRTREVLAFPDDFLKIVLEQQSTEDDSASYLRVYANMPLDDEGKCRKSILHLFNINPLHIELFLILFLNKSYP